MCFQDGSVVNNPPANAGAAGDSVQCLSFEHPLEEEMAAHSSILVWKIPLTEEAGGLQSRGHKESDTTEQLTLPHLVNPGSLF